MNQKFAITPDDLENVTGGVGENGGGNRKGEVKTCPECGELALQIPIMGGQYRCEACGRTYVPQLASMENGKEQEK